MRNKNIWVFNSGLSFDGNPKYLFLYLKKHHPEIDCYWFCYNKECLNYVKNLGYKACLFDSREAKNIGKRAGVYVVNQFKEVIQPYLEGIVILNLWHGVGCKTIEKQIINSSLVHCITKKWIKNNQYYMNNQLFLVTSPLMEKHFLNGTGLSNNQIIRAGYPCCINTNEIKTFDHDILKGRNLPENAKIAVYAPTYRDNDMHNFLPKAIPDIDKLISTLKENNFVLIFKLHPNMTNEYYYNNIKKYYSNCPNLIFWDNSNDIYEIFKKIDLAIIDYSSIFYDMLAHNVKHFVRYFFDYDEISSSSRNRAFEYIDYTCGKICNNFDELLASFNNYENNTTQEEIDKINKLFWEYSTDDSLEKIFNATMNFEAKTEELPTLYSFDIFDTLLKRSVHLPIGVFYYVQDKIKESNAGFDRYFSNYYFKIRHWAERDCREYNNKSQLYRKSDKIEITYNQIFNHMQNVYSLTNEQVDLLKEWELEGEYLTIKPIKENIDLIKELINANEKVILISDMYLNKDAILKLLEKADPILTQLPLFVSSEYGNMKINKKLFFDVFNSIDYKYGKWIHYGDNPESDNSIPSQLGIICKSIDIKEFNDYEKELINFDSSFDSYQVSTLFKNFRYSHLEASDEQIYAYSYASLYFVPYVNWAIKHAIKQGFECLYFISRDGFHLKRIADVIIEKKVII